MTGETIQLVPPPGPVAWLWPELAEPAAAAAPRRVPASRTVLDLGRTPLFGAALLERLRGVASVVVPAGPLGRTLRGVLRERLRDSGRDVPITVDPAAPSPDDLFALPRASEGETGVGGPTLLPIDPAHAAERLDGLLAAAREDREGLGSAPVPYFLTRPPPDDGEDLGRAPVSTRLAESFFGLLPGDVYPDAVRTRWHDLVRTLRPDRFLRLLALENQALAGFDPYEEVLRGRFEDPPPPSRPRPRARIVAIDGIDGAGKSSHVAALRALLEARGLVVAVHRLFRHGVFHDTVTDVTRRCAGGHALHLWPLQRRVKVFDSLKAFCTTIEPDLETADVVLFDRYVTTHLAAARGRYHHDPYGVEWLRVLPAADVGFVLDLPEDEALSRIGARSARTVDENPYMLSRYRAVLLDLARADGYEVLDARADFERNRALIADAVLRCLPERAR